jgi:hypothetical protein
MRVFKNMIQAKKNLDQVTGVLELQTEVMVLQTDTLKRLTKKHAELLDDTVALAGALAAEREQKERYRTAFLSRMNVPVIGKAWTGDDYSEES